VIHILLDGNIFCFANINKLTLSSLEINSCLNDSTSSLDSINVAKSKSIGGHILFIGRLIKLFLLM
jgi:hypothetical protein